MSAVLDNTWGPYTSQSDARFALGRFADRACGPDLGLAWSSGGMLYPLRKPTYDRDGFGDVLTIEWNPPTLAPKYHAAPAQDFWHRMMRIIERGLELNAQAEIDQAQAMNAFANSVLSSRFAQHSLDGAGVALDAVGVVASLFLLPELGVLGGIALLCSGFLLLADGTIYGTEMAGNDEKAERIKRKTEGWRIGATILCFPDLIWNGGKALLELKEAEELLRVDRTAAQTAQRASVKPALKAQAAKYAEIAEKANLRNQIRSRQIQAGLKLDISPRVAGAAGSGLLIRDEVLDDKSLLNKLTQWMRVHVVAVQQ